MQIGATELVSLVNLCLQTIAFCFALMIGRRLHIRGVGYIGTAILLMMVRRVITFFHSAVELPHWLRMTDDYVLPTFISLLLLVGCIVLDGELHGLTIRMTRCERARTKQHGRALQADITDG